MDAIVGIVAEVLLLGSSALLVWGAILTLGQLFRGARRREVGDERRETVRTAIASGRRRRFGRLSAH